ncbi:MAG: class IV adenylate cyclase [Nanoarchaeota archaeon]|nr:class IV adenylate cyclase [Nanoarchaeota archaeon]
MDEIELKFLNINVEEIKTKIENLGAVLKYNSQTESYPFLAKGFHSSDSNMKYLRIRKINEDIQITYKDPAKKSDMTIREEIEIKVDNYENAILLLEKLGFEKGKVFRKHRMHYDLGDIHFELDTLENIPTYLEIETKTELEMKNICSKLGLDISNGKKGTIVEILPEMFNN